MLEKQSSMQKGDNLHANVIVENFSIEKNHKLIQVRKVH